MFVVWHYMGTWFDVFYLHVYAMSIKHFYKLYNVLSTPKPRSFNVFFQEGCGVRFFQFLQLAGDT